MLARPLALALPLLARLQALARLALALPLLARLQLAAAAAALARQGLARLLLARPNPLQPPPSPWWLPALLP